MGLKRAAGARRDAYVSGYLRSRAWFARRDAFLASQADEAGMVTCACCDTPHRARAIDVHHLDYAGVRLEGETRWVSREADEDLMALCRWCHERVHRLMDTDRGWASLGRREATVSVVRAIQRQLIVTAIQLEKQQGGGVR